MIRTAATRKRQPWRTMAGLVFAMLLIGFVLTSSFAQVLVGSGGHALDASLQLGSAGYNTQTRSSTVLRNQYNYNRYGNSPYRVNSFGGYSYNPRYNSLAPAVLGRGQLQPVGCAGLRRFFEQWYADWPDLSRHATRLSSDAAAGRVQLMHLDLCEAACAKMIDCKYRGMMRR